MPRLQQSEFISCHLHPLTNFTLRGMQKNKIVLFTNFTKMFIHGSILYLRLLQQQYIGDTRILTPILQTEKEKE